VDERATKLSESVLEEADRNGVLRWKEELDAKHLQSSLTDGCVCGLCKAARTALAESPSEPPAVPLPEEREPDTDKEFTTEQLGAMLPAPPVERDTRTAEELAALANAIENTIFYRSVDVLETDTTQLKKQIANMIRSRALRAGETR
jgi:hypothetical protein